MRLLERAAEEIEYPAADVTVAEVMAESWKVELLKALVGLHEGTHHLQRRDGIHILVEFAVDEQQVAFKAVRVRHVRVLGVPGTDRVAHPLLVPPHLVHAVVVATAERNSSAVEVAMEEKGAEGVLFAGRVAVDANAGEMPPLRHPTPGPLVPPPEMC